MAERTAEGSPRRSCEGHGSLTTTSAVHTEDLYVRIGGRNALCDVGVTIAPGEFVAVLGPNGAGKTTLLKAILGLLPVAEGQISVFGRSPGHGSTSLAYLPQRHAFESGLRIRGIDLVRLGLDGHRWGFPVPLFGGRTASGRASKQRVDEAIDEVGAAAYAHRPIGEMSGGEQQRLLIAQALVRRPALMLLDEPLDSLDLPNQAAVAALIDDVRRQNNITVMLVAHDVNPILPYLDRVIYLAAGHAVSGAPEDVISSETLSRLYDTPIEVLRASDGRLVVVGHPDPPAMHTDRHVHGSA